jgi:alkylation response protein AidB-like acyl-CoA dehydrogenase
MDYSDAPEQAEFRAEFRAWLTDNHPGPTPDFRDSATEQASRMAWHRTMYAGGWLGLSWPKAYGGRELSPLFEAIINEELGEAGVLNAVGPLNWLGRAILLFGTEQQRRQYLVPLLRGETQWCQGFSEPGAGSDLAGLSTYAERDGETYLVTGQKLWTSGAQFADYCMVLVRTDRDLPKRQGISCLIAEMKAPGITVHPITQSWGGQRFCEVFFDATPVPVANRLGDEGDGWGLASAVLAYERGPSEVGVVAAWRSRLRALREQSSGDAVRELAYGRAFADAQACQIRLMEALSRRARGEDPGPSSSVDKLLMVRAEQSLGASLFDVSAAPAVVGNDPLTTKHYIYSRAASIYGGTEQIQKSIVATRILGLPR